MLDCSEQLCRRVTEEVVDNKDDLVKTAADILYDKMPNPKLEKIKQHEEAKLKIYEDFYPQLIKLFGPFLKLTDNPEK